MLRLSLAYKVHEIERHLHGRERWFGKKAVQTATDWADNTLTPYRCISGNNTYGGGKLMLTTAHIQRYESWMGDWLAELAPAWAKIVNPPAGFVIPNVAKSCVRIWTDNIDAGFIAGGRRGGRDFVRAMYPQWSKNPATCYELANEPDCNTNSGLANLREYTIGAIEEAINLGIKLCVFNIAEGNPHDNGLNDPNVSAWKWTQLQDAARACADAGMWMGRHCYWRPGIEGPTGRWHSLGRLEWDLSILNVPNLKVLVNEIGIDGGIANGPTQKGWKALTTDGLYRQEIVSAEQYARTKIPQVEALMYFTYGYNPPWDTFDHGVAFANSLIAPLKGVPEQEQEDASGHLRIELARPLAYTPATNKVTQWFGENPAMYAPYGLAGHNGLDYRAPEGTPILAMHSGIVRNYDQGSVGLGKYVKVIYVDGRRDQRYETRCAHLSNWNVYDGAKVRRGDVVGFSGNTGNSTGPHVHADLKVYGMVNQAYADRIDLSPFRTA